MTIEDYILIHSSPEPEILHDLERESNLRMVHGRMCSGHLQGRLLKMFVQMICPSRILELGTFTGYSALCMAEGLAEGSTDTGQIVTIEANDELEDFLREQFAKSPFGNRIELHIGNALDIMKRLESNSFDLIFMDADKREYSAYYIEGKRLLRQGGFILADNTLWDGHVVEERKHDSQTSGIIRFNDLVATDNDTEQVILPFRDGLSIIRKK